ncbi:MAG: CsgG/HfaB family protein [Verrucomicrobiota bacterium]|nr:CsgG/HfaB family protein [Verrucomicrobiota bacterium]
MRTLRTVVAGMLAAGALSFSGCALLGTTTTQANIKMDLPEYAGLKHAIGCKDFENQAGWHGQWHIGNNLSIMLESALFDTKRFVIVEREKLKDVIAEQDLAASGRTAKAKNVAKTGLIRPARYLATGAITTVEENTSGGGGGISAFGVRLGGSAAKASITIIAKLVDTTTGEIVAKETIKGSAGSAGLSAGVSLGPVSTDMGAFKKTPLGDAAQDCINKAAYFFAKTITDKKLPFEGSVAKVSGDKVIINRGFEYGLQVGKDLVMQEEGDLVTDPDTGAVLEKEKGKEIGKLKVSKVSEKLSYCAVTEGEKNPKPGTVVVEP